MASAKCKYTEQGKIIFSFSFSISVKQSRNLTIVQDGECVNPVKLIKRKIRVLQYLFCYVPNSALRGVKCCNLTSLPRCKENCKLFTLNILLAE